MHIRSVRRIVKSGLIGAALTSLQACSPAAAPGEYSVIDAYKASDTIAIQPYTRSIFSTNNF